MVFIIRTANRDTIYGFSREEIKEKEVRLGNIYYIEGHPKSNNKYSDLLSSFFK